MAAPIDYCVFSLARKMLPNPGNGLTPSLDYGKMWRGSPRTRLLIGVDLCRPDSGGFSTRRLPHGSIPVKRFGSVTLAVRSARAVREKYFSDRFATPRRAETLLRPPPLTCHWPSLRNELGHDNLTPLRAAAVLATRRFEHDAFPIRFVTP